jgi:hypothetical protein
MMHCNYVAIDGSKKDFDLDAVVDVVRGFSGIRSKWESILVFDPDSKVFIELRDSPPNVHGDSQGECEQVTDEYLISHCQLTIEDIAFIRENPEKWKLVDKRR